MITYYSKLLHQTWFGLAMGGGVPWLWPLCRVLHFVGLTLLFGSAAIVDLRMLGVAKAFPLAPLRKLLPWGAAGFAINLLSGFGFYAGFPAQYMSWAFLFKMLLVVFAGINVLVFYTSGLQRRVDAVGSGGSVPFAAKVCAAASLALWVGVMFLGRMLPMFSSTF